MLNEWIKLIRSHLAARSAREQRFLLIGSAALIVLLSYGAVYEPTRTARAKLVERLPVQRAELRLMQVQAAEIERLRSHLGETGKLGLEQRIKSSAAAFGLGEDFTRFTPLTQDQFLIATQPLPNGTWTEWLGDMERQGITVTRCRITMDDQLGLASLELTLTGGRR